MQEHKYPTAFPLKHAQKDVRLALELAHQHGQQLPTAAAANGLYEKVCCSCLPLMLCLANQLTDGYPYQQRAKLWHWLLAVRK